MISVLWVLVLPLLLAGVGLVFISIAFKDRVDARSDDGSRQLPTRHEHPLYHLHMKIRSGQKPPSASRAPDAGVAKFPKRH
jgi:hypothetical protein